MNNRSSKTCCVVLLPFDYAPYDCTHLHSHDSHANAYTLTHAHVRTRPPAQEERAKRHAEAAALRRDAGLRSLQVQGLEGQIAALEEEARDGLVRHHRLLAEHQRLRLQAARLEVRAGG